MPRVEDAVPQLVANHGHVRVHHLLLVAPPPDHVGDLAIGGGVRAGPVLLGTAVSGVFELAHEVPQPGHPAAVEGELRQIRYPLYRAERRGGQRYAGHLTHRQHGKEVGAQPVPSGVVQPFAHEYRELVRGSRVAPREQVGAAAGEVEVRLPGRADERQRRDVPPGEPALLAVPAVDVVERTGEVRQRNEIPLAHHDRAVRRRSRISVGTEPDAVLR